MSLIETGSKDITNETEKKCVRKTCCGIYGLQNKLNPDKWYVGQSVDIQDRFKSYRLLKTKKQQKLHNALLKYGYDGFNKVIIETCDEATWLLDYREIFWIKQLNSISNGYNIREGGRGGRISESTKEKLRNINLGKRMSPETLLKMKNRPKHTEEAKRKMSIAAKGHRCSEQTKQKMRDFWIKKGLPLTQVV